ncbi:carbon storage regulator [bacterium]|nr:carbon storage regulator [bacterium]
MLVLTRKMGEKLIIGENIVIEILKCGKEVKIGIEAPRDVTVLREELFDRLQPGLQTLQHRKF